ncbi:MAG: hypothetical protein ABSD20_06210 [Terriglobales bacterium]|jgi:hypothetical protein
MKRMLLISLVAFSMQLFAQSDIPAGTVLPVSLNTSLHSRKVQPGEPITARIMQDVPLASGSTIRSGAKVTGHVVDVQPPTATRGASISLRFDAVEVSKRQIPIVTNLRAIASMMAVDEAQIPETGPDRGTPMNAWTTEQIGGEVVYRGGGPVARGDEVVGTPATNGVLVRVSSSPGDECRGEIDGNHRPQATWVFSSDACGAYGLPYLAIAHAGRTNPVGTIMLRSPNGDLSLRAGSGLLLRVH